eukprot:gnl/TRDRNA2_/TRDRNA2_82278_c0_seq1.p1 gnl/TRDRNA2_/TRDRNA2_82278_c0~~gnl/TRDRNA2_/TRDRNA2_82278_c0_seq1.p1  ORF type:complete len:162 (-),score=16.26 gnl/TRDRNA2_/TRDRNA2_82278_c0_seq1:95-580(-)
MLVFHILCGISCRQSIFPNIEHTVARNHAPCLCVHICVLHMNKVIVPPSAAAQESSGSHQNRGMFLKAATLDLVRRGGGNAGESPENLKLDALEENDDTDPVSQSSFSATALLLLCLCTEGGRGGANDDTDPVSHSSFSALLLLVLGTAGGRGRGRAPLFV